jgi:hypothetical protein
MFPTLSSIQVGERHADDAAHCGSPVHPRRCPARAWRSLFIGHGQLDTTNVTPVSSSTVASRTCRRVKLDSAVDAYKVRAGVERRCCHGRRVRVDE